MFKIILIINIFFITQSFAKQTSPQFNINIIKSALFNTKTVEQNSDDDIIASYGNYDDNIKDADPLQKYNRFIFRGNIFIDKHIINYGARIYNYVPQEIRLSLSNVYANINYTPKFMVYSVLQLDFEGLAITMWRFGINSTLGVFGLYDIAGMFGLQPVDKDIDQTLSCYEIPSGPFFILPILGANTLTNAIELPVYWVLSLYNPYANIFGFSNTYSLPFSFLGPNYINTIISNYFAILYVPKILNTRINFEVLMQDLNNTSIDGYITLKDFYLQNQKYNIKKENEAMTSGRLPKEKPLILSTRINEPLFVSEWQEKEDIVQYNFN